VFDRISNSWELVKVSFNILRSDRELMLFPIVSAIGTIIVTVVFFIPLLATGVVTSGDASGSEVLLLILAFLFYFVMYTVIIFSNTALVSAAMMRLRGEKPTVRDGFRMASERIGPILGYAAISATVGVILNMLRDEENFLGQIVASIVSVAWNLITFLVIPVLVVENVGPIEAIKRSGSLLKRTWGEQVVGAFGIGMVVFLISLAAALVIGGPLVWLASLTGSDISVMLAVGVVVIIVMGINLVGTAMNGIFQAALYNYATTGESGEFFEEGVLRGAFQPK
jgi:hypothetical protein